MTRFFLVLLLLGGRLALAAPCCGGTANTPSLISGDDRAQISATVSSANVSAEADVLGRTHLRRLDDNEALQTLRLDAATLLSDRFQMGFTLPVLRRARARAGTEASASGIGDMSLNLGYEILPEWTYSSWRPRGWLFLTTTLPTGGSLYDSHVPYRLDSRGRGFLTFSLGGLFVKNWGDFDFAFLWEGHRSLSREIENPMGNLVLRPGWGTSGMLSGGWSPFSGSFRLGMALAPSFEQAVATEGLFSGQGEAISLWTASAQLSYMASSELSMSLIYSDQTLIPASSNSALHRTFAVLFQKRWER